MCPRRLGADDQLFGDSAGLHPAGDEAEHLAFSRREVGEPEQCHLVLVAAPDQLERKEPSMVGGTRTPTGDAAQLSRARKGQSLVR